VCKDSYIDEALRLSQSDQLFKVQASRALSMLWLNTRAIQTPACRCNLRAVSSEYGRAKVEGLFRLLTRRSGPLPHELERQLAGAKAQNGHFQVEHREDFAMNRVPFSQARPCGQLSCHVLHQP